MKTEVEYTMSKERLVAGKGADVLTYLEDKYHRQFEIISAIGQSWEISGDLWGVKPLYGSNGDCFTVVGKNAGRYALSDAYYSVLIRLDYQAFAERCASKIFDLAKMFVKLRSTSTRSQIS